MQKSYHLSKIFGDTVVDSSENIPERKPIHGIIEQLLVQLGEDPKREGLLGTPGRVERSLRFLTSGYGQDIDTVLNDAFFASHHDEMVIVKGIEFYSLCEHHLLPFFGTCHVAYLPKKRVIGLSKVSRIVEIFCRRLQIQEQLTGQIAETIMSKAAPHGVGVVIEAQHLCMMMRGVEKQNAEMVTSAMLGTFKTDSKTRAEFLELIRRSKR